MLQGVSGRLVTASVVVIVLFAAHLPAASAADPGRWKPGIPKAMSRYYSQGITVDSRTHTFYLDGNLGLYRANASLHKTGGISDVIPLEVKHAEHYNHLGDLSFDTSDGGRLLLPLECLYGKRNTCQTGSIAVADPGSLRWLYYVKLDPAYIKKAMWVEASPDGRWIWTSSGKSLLAYNAAEVTRANAAPAGPKLLPKFSTQSLPVPGVSGATFVGDRLFLALNRGAHVAVVSYGINSTGPAPVLVDGPRPEIELKKNVVFHETEGLATAGAMNRELRWQIRPNLPIGVGIFPFLSTS
jgi:hypothetical protein